MKTTIFKSFFIILLLSVYAGCSNSGKLIVEQNKETVRQFVKAVNDRDYDALDELMTNNFTRHCQATPDIEINSKEDMKHFLEGNLATFPDSKVTMSKIIGEYNMIAGLFTFEATQEGPMGPFPATGKKAKVDYLGIMRLEEGKIAEMWVEWDNLSILGQLGLYPPTD